MSARECILGGARACVSVPCMYTDYRRHTGAQNYLRLPTCGQKNYWQHVDENMRPVDVRKTIAVSATRTVYDVLYD